MTDPREPGKAFGAEGNELEGPPETAFGASGNELAGPPREADLPLRGIGADVPELELTPPPIPSESQLGPVPAVAGSDRMRAMLRARLFGDAAPAPSDDDDDHEERDHASRSGVIGGLDTDPGDDVRRHVDSDAEPELADRIGRFRVLDRLGRGGMGVVSSA